MFLYIKRIILIVHAASSFFPFYYSHKKRLYEGLIKVKCG